MQWAQVYQVLFIYNFFFIYKLIIDTFASKLSAIQDTTADAAIGNVTGSNAVNVFLGIGVAWTLASIYHSYFANNVFYVHAGSLSTSLALFLIGLQ